VKNPGKPPSSSSLALSRKVAFCAAVEKTPPLRWSL